MLTSKKEPPFTISPLPSFTGCLFSSVMNPVSFNRTARRDAGRSPVWFPGMGRPAQSREDFNYERTADISLSNPSYAGGGQNVFQFRSERQAARIFERQLRREFNSSSVASETPWQIPPELPYTSKVADQFHFACHISNINGLSEICKMMGQYDKYLVILSMHMTPDYMTYADLEKVLEAVDKKMADALAEGVK